MHGEFEGNFLVKFPTLGRQENHIPLYTRSTVTDTLDSPKDWLRLKYHALTSTKWTVIHCLMPILCESSQIMNLDTHLLLLLSLADDAMRKRAVEIIREYGDDMECQN